MPLFVNIVRHTNNYGHSMMYFHNLGYRKKEAPDEIDLISGFQIITRIILIFGLLVDLTICIFLKIMKFNIFQRTVVSVVPSI